MRKNTDATQALVGHAFRCPDGLVRWIISLSDRGNFTLLWLDEETSIWNMGGTSAASRWVGGEEYTVPALGDSYQMYGVLGSLRTKIRDF